MSRTLLKDSIPTLTAAQQQHQNDWQAFLAALALKHTAKVTWQDLLIDPTATEEPSY